MTKPIMLGVPVFREDQAMVEEALGSFLDPMVDVVVVDNGATPEAKAGITAFDGRVDVIRNESNIYCNPAWNQIVSERFLKSDAEILVVANADVVVAKGWAQALYARKLSFLQNKEIWFCSQTWDVEQARRGVDLPDPTETPYRTMGGFFFALPREAVPLVFPIPEPVLIWYGDNWIFETLERTGYRRVSLRDMLVWHAESVTQKRMPELGTVLHNDKTAWDHYLWHACRREADAISRGKPMDNIERQYISLRDVPHDINEHMPIIRCYAERCEHVTEFGVGRSSWALLHSRPKVMRSYDIFDRPALYSQTRSTDLVPFGTAAGVDIRVEHGNSLQIDIEPTDLLFIDTLHTYSQLKQELERHSVKVKRCIVMHDTETFGFVGEDGSQPGLVAAVDDFLSSHHEWSMRDRLKNNNGLTILERVSP